MRQVFFARTIILLLLNIVIIVGVILDLVHHDFFLTTLIQLFRVGDVSDFIILAKIIVLLVLHFRICNRLLRLGIAL